VAVSRTGSGPPVRACRARGGGARRSPLPSGRELSSGGCRTDGSCALGTCGRCVVTTRGAGWSTGRDGLEARWRSRGPAPGLPYGRFGRGAAGRPAHLRGVVGNCRPAGVEPTVRAPSAPRGRCVVTTRGARGAGHWTRRPGGPVAVSWTGPGPPVRAFRARRGGAPRSPPRSGRELSSGGCRTDGSCALGARGRCVVTTRGVGLPVGAPGVQRYACSAVFSWMPSPLRCSASTAPLTLLRRNRMFGVPESAAALTVFGVPSGFGAAPTSTTLVPAVT